MSRNNTLASGVRAKGALRLRSVQQGAGLEARGEEGIEHKAKGALRLRQKATEPKTNQTLFFSFS